MRTEGASAWSEAELAELRRRWTAGESDQEIAAALRPTRTVRAVAIKRSKMGMIKRKVARRGSVSSMASETLVAELRVRGVLDGTPEPLLVAERLKAGDERLADARARLDQAEQRIKSLLAERRTLTKELQAVQSKLDRRTLSLRSADRRRVHELGEAADKLEAVADELQRSNRAREQLEADLKDARARLAATGQRLDSARLGELMEEIRKHGYSCTATPLPGSSPRRQEPNP